MEDINFKEKRKKMNDITKIVQALEDSNILWKGEMKQMKQKNKKEDS